MTAIEARGVEKVYSVEGGQTVPALRGVDLTVRAGEIYALLGPNGAGKSTLIAVLTTLLLPTRGTAQVAGYDVIQQAAEVRRRIGVTFQELVVDGELTGRQALDFHARLYGIDGKTRRQRITDLANLVELTDALDRKAGGYSGGMKRRLELARGLMTAPQVLFLDEPTQGLDPQNRVNIWQYIRQLRDQQGVTVLLTTHYMEEAQALADRVGIIDHGLLLVEGAPDALSRQLGADVITLRGSGAVEDFQSLLDAQPYVAGITRHEAADDCNLQIGVDDGERRLAQVIGLAAGAGFHVQQVSAARPTLADVFLKYTGHELRDL